MKKFDGSLIFSPTDLTRFMENPYITWMDRYFLEFPNKITPDPDDEEMEIVQDRGLEHEQNYLERLKNNGADVCEISDHVNARALTLEAMSQGREVIYQASLSANNFSGYADFLQKIAMDSHFGPYGYEVWDTKLARKPKPYFVIQLSVVAWIGAEMEFALSQAVASGDTLEHRPSECGHCVQDFLAELDLRDLPGEAAGLESAADDTLPTADLRFYPAALVVPCGHLPGHAAVAADLSNMAIPNGWIPRRLRSDHCVLWRRYNHIQGLPIPFPQQIPCGRSIIGAVSQKARDRGIELIQEPG